MESLCAIAYPSGSSTVCCKISDITCSKALIDPLLLKSCVIFYDENIDLSYIKPYAKLFEVERIYPLPCTEQGKCRRTKEKLEDYLNDQGFGKDCTVIAIGGGILCDIVGFVAATYLAGVNLVFIPTTLLCMVDASIGGKVAVNLAPYKNRIGLFYPASLVIFDVQFLQTLPSNVLRDGMAEVVKYGCILDPSLLDDVEALVKIQDLYNNACFFSIIERSIQCKALCVGKDPYDKGLRRILNFGHTAGHALEACHSLTISHGQAVACGIVIELFISFCKGYIAAEEVTRIANLLEGLGFDFYATMKSIDPSMMLEHMRKDKKSIQGEIFCTTLAALGRVNECSQKFIEAVSDVDVLRALELFRSYFHGGLCLH